MWPANYANIVFGCICLIQVFVFAVSQHLDLNNEDLTKHLDNIKFLNKQTEKGSPKHTDNSFDFENSDLGELTDEDKRALDRYSFFGGLGKRGLDRYNFFGGIGKRALDKYGFFGGIGKRALDRYGFAGSLGKRGLDRYSFMGGIGKRGLDRYGFAGSLGKRALDRYGFIGSLGKRKLDRFGFMGGLGKRRLDSHRFFGGLGKRAADQYENQDAASSAEIAKLYTGEKPMQKRLYPYWYYRQSGRPIFTQTRGIDRFSFAARLGRR